MPKVTAFDKPTKFASQETPQMYMIKLPINIRAIVDITDRPKPRSENHPSTKTAIRNPKRYPPVGPNNTTRPEVPPAKTGAPNAPCRRYKLTVVPPRKVPYVSPSNKITSVCAVTGTGWRGTLIYEDKAIKTLPTITRSVFAKNWVCLELHLVKSKNESISDL